MAWDSEVNLTQEDNITNTERPFDEFITSADRDDVIHVQVEGDFVATNDDMLWRVYTTLDDTSEVWDTVSILTVRMIANTTTNPVLSFQLVGFYKYKLTVAAAGATDTHTDANARYRKAS